jgi:hypothetical protein
MQTQVLRAYVQDADPVKQGLTDVIVCSVHFGKDACGAQYIHLNDTPPDSAVNQRIWEYAVSSGSECHVMVGGAGGAFQQLFDNFEPCFELLASMLDSKPFVKSIDLDIEERVALVDVVVLVARLKDRFPLLQVTISCVAEDLVRINEPSVFAGFCYADFVCAAGSSVAIYHVQAYNEGEFSAACFASILAHGLIDESKLCMGMMSSQTDTAINQVPALNALGCRGYFVWNNHDMPHNWAQRIRAASAAANALAATNQTKTNQNEDRGALVNPSKWQQCAVL